MSFARSKRFVDKKPDISPSPADYPVTTKLEKGCKIAKSPRFQKPAQNDDTPSTCSRTTSRSGSFRSSTPKLEKEHNTGLDIESLKRKILELNRYDIHRQSFREKSTKTSRIPRAVNSTSFNRNGINRQSFRRKPEGNKETTTTSSSNSLKTGNNFGYPDYEKFHSPRQPALADHSYNINAFSLDSLESNNDIADQDSERLYLPRSDAAIKHDYLSSNSLEFYNDSTNYANFNKLDRRKSVKGKIKELCSDFGRTQISSREQRRDSATRRDSLQNIHNQVKSIKDDLHDLGDFIAEHMRRKTGGGKKHLEKQRCLPGSTKYDTTNCVIRNTVQFLREQLELHEKSLGKDTEGKIRSILTNIIRNKEKSAEQFHELCCNTSNRLSEYFTMTININHPSATESRPANKNVTNEVSMSHNGNEEDDDDLDFSLKFGDSQELLELQESLLDALKHDLADLKESFCKLK